MIYIWNTKDEPFEAAAYIPCGEENSFCFINPESLETYDITVQAKDKRAEIPVKFPPLSPVIICKY